MYLFFIALTQYTRSVPPSYMTSMKIEAGQLIHTLHMYIFIFVQGQHNDFEANVYIGGTSNFDFVVHVHIPFALLQFKRIKMHFT